MMDSGPVAKPNVFCFDADKVRGHSFFILAIPKPPGSLEEIGIVFVIRVIPEAIQADGIPLAPAYLSQHREVELGTGGHATNLQRSGPLSTHAGQADVTNAQTARSAVASVP